MPKAPIGNRRLIRELNRSTVLNTIRREGPLGRSQIARMTGLSPATVSSLTADLLEQQLVLESETGESSGGRRPILLELNPEGGFVIGIKLTETQVVGALIDLYAEVRAKRSDPLHGHEPEQVVAAIDGVVAALLKESGAGRERLLGVGVGLAGVVDGAAGVSRQHPYFGWNDVPLAKLLRERLETRVQIDNDVNALTQAERLYGVGLGVDDFLTVTVGRGVGLGIVIDGRIYRGARGGGGEIGHTVVDPAGPACSCGKSGCLEAYVGEAGLLLAAEQAAEADRLPAVASVDELLRLADEGQPAAAEILSEAGRLLGQSLANLIDVLNPAMVLISGEGVRYGDTFFAPLRRAVHEQTMPALRGDAEIRVDPWGDDAWAVGAASLVLHELFVSPLHRSEQPAA